MTSSATEETLTEIIQGRLDNDRVTNVVARCLLRSNSALQTRESCRMLRFRRASYLDIESIMGLVLKLAAYEKCRDA
eukprot:4577415-Ditylum_brightwellii.AAC.1